MWSDNHSSCSGLHMQEVDNTEIFVLNWTGMQPSHVPETARVPKENGKHISEDLNIFFSKII